MGERLDYLAVICGANSIQTDKKYSKYYPYHHREGHAFKQYVTFRRIFYKKLQKEEIILWNEGARNVHE